MKAIIVISAIILTIWATTGFVYFVVDILRDLDREALVNPNISPPKWKEVLYGPIYWGICLLVPLLALIIRAI